MPDKKYLIEIPGMPEGSGVWDAAKWERNKDVFMKDYPEANVFELGAYDADDAQETDQIMLDLGVEEMSGIWDNAKWERNKDAFMQDFPEAVVSRVRYVDYWGNKAKENRAQKALLEQPDQERMNRLAELGYYDDISGAQIPLDIKGPNALDLKPLSSAIEEDKITGEAIYHDPKVQEFFANDTATTERMAEIARLDEEYESNPSVIEYKQWLEEKRAADAAYAAELEQKIKSDMESEVDSYHAGLGAVAKHSVDPYGANMTTQAIRMIQREDVSRDLVENEKQERYTSALKLLQKAKDAREVASKGFGGAVGDVAKDWLRDNATQSDLEMYSEVGNILSRLEAKVGNLNELTDEQIEANLSNDEKALVRAFFEYNAAMAEAGKDMSTWYKGGKIFAESVPFMLEFLATGGLYKGAGRAATKWMGKGFAKWIGKSAAKTTARAAKVATTKLVSGAVKVGVGTLARTVASPGTYSRIAEASVEIDNEGHLNRVKNATIGLADMYIENLSEISGVLVGKGLGLLGKGLGAVTKGTGKVIDKGVSLAIGKTPFATLGKILGDNRAMQQLAKAWGASKPKLAALGFHGLPEEVGEEFIGNTIRDVFNVQPGALKEMVEDDNFSAMLIGFAPMTLLGGVGGAAQIGVINYQAANLGQQIRDSFLNMFDNEQLDYMMNGAKNAKSSEEIWQAIKPFVVSVKMAEANGQLNEEEAKEKVEMLYQYGGFMAQNNALLFAKKEQDKQLANAKRDELANTYGRFWQETENEDVQIATLNDGRTVFVTSTPAEDGKIAIVDAATGRKGFASTADIASEEKDGETIQKTSTMTMDAFLGLQIANERKTAEEVRMSNERMAQIDALSKEIVPGKTEINVGTEGSPILMLVSGMNRNGVKVIGQDGVEHDMSWEKAADYLGKPIMVKTDKQIADEYVAARAAELAERRKARNASPATEVATQETAQQTEEVAEAENVHIPMNEDGTVNEEAFWEQNPEEYVKWNDEQNKDGGQDSLEQIAIAKAELTKQLGDAQNAQATSNPTVRKQAKAEAERLADKIIRLDAIEQTYAEALAKETEAIKETQATPTTTMSEEDLVKMDEQYQSILGKTKVQSERVRVMQEYLNKLAENSVPVVLLTQQNYEKRMREEGAEEYLIDIVREQVNAGEPVAGFMAAGKVYLMEDGLNSIDDARVTYVHERQHTFNRTNPELVQRVAKALGSKENALAILKTFVGPRGLLAYINNSLEALADEIICRSMEIAYSTEEFSVDLQSRGISDEVISIITEIDNEQRQNQDLAHARRRGRGNSYAAQSGAGSLREDGRNLDEISGGLLGQEGSRPAETSERGDALRESAEVAAQNEELPFRIVGKPEDNLSEETKQELADKGLVMEGGVIMSDDYAELKHETGYLTPIEEGATTDDVRFSVVTMPGWKQNYLKYQDADKRVVRVLEAFADRITANELVNGVIAQGKHKSSKKTKDGRLVETGPLRSNISYVVTFDLDTTCPRTFQYLNYVKRIERRIGRPLTQIECIQLNEMMRMYGQQIPCVYCYAENKRQAMKQYFNNYIASRHAVLSAETDEEALKHMYGHEAEGTDPKAILTEAAYKVFKKWRKNPKGTYNPTMRVLWHQYDQARNSVLSLLDMRYAEGAIKTDAADDTLAKMVAGELGISNKTAVRAIEEIVVEWKWNTIEGVAHDDFTRMDEDDLWANENALEVWRDMTLYAKSASGAKNVNRYVPYTDELKNVDQATRDYINGMGGLRMHSTNDFRIDYVFDYFQFLADMAAAKMFGHTYTKSPEFVRIFGNSGYKINMSIAAYQDENGVIRPNVDEGFDWNEAKELRRLFPHAGTMLMATSDEQLQMALDSDWIDMCIPFHHSGLPKAVWYNMRLWTDYTTVQNERYFNNDERIAMLAEAGVELPKKISTENVEEIFNEHFGIKVEYGTDGKRVKPHFLPGPTIVKGVKIPGHNNDHQEYLRLCKMYGVKPRFEGIKVKDNTPEGGGRIVDITEHPRYMILVKETARTDTPQTAIQFNFDQPSDALGGKSPMDYAFDELEARAMAESDLAGGKVRDIYTSLKQDQFGIVEQFLNTIIKHKEETGEDYPMDYLTPESREWFLVQRKAFEEAFKDIETIPYHRNEYDEQGNLTKGKGLEREEGAIDLVEEAKKAQAKHNEKPSVSFRFTPRTAEQREQMFDAAKAEFGTAKRFKTAGYMLPDGSLLDFSEWKDGGNPNQRTQDHREIARVMEDRDYESRYDYIVDFMDEGAIRVIPEFAGLQMTTKPSEQQEKKIWDFIYTYDGEIILQIDDENGGQQVYMEYDRRTPASKIFRDINGYFNDGVVPQMQEAVSFRVLDTSKAELKEKPIKLNGAYRFNLKNAFKGVTGAEDRYNYLKAEIVEVGEGFEGPSTKFDGSLNGFATIYVPKGIITEGEKENQYFVDPKDIESQLWDVLKAADNYYEFKDNFGPRAKEGNWVNADVRFRFTPRTEEQREKLFEDAKAHYGVTNNFNGAGYMLPDGSLLDFSESNDGGDPNHRSLDHRDIEGLIMDEGKVYDSRYHYVIDFVKEGPIRMLPEYAGFQLSVPPTKEQRSRLMDYIYKHNGEVIMEITDQDGSPRVYMEYNKRTSPSRIFKDMNEFFDNGTTPGLPPLRFRVTPEQDKAYVDAVIDGDMETAQRMVLEAAKLAMPNTKVVDEEGNPKVVYHGTTYGGFTKFGKTPDKHYQNVGIFFADQRKAVEDYTYGANKDIDNFFPFDKFADGQLEIVNDWLKNKAKGNYNQGVQVAEKDGVWTIVNGNGRPVKDGRGNIISGQPKVVMGIIQAREQHTPEFEGKGIYPVYLNLQAPFVIDAQKQSWHSLPKTVNGITIPDSYDAGNRGVVATDDWADYLQSEEGEKLGYDSIIVENTYDSETADGVITDYIAFVSSQAKLAATVTYDNKGRIIPLSKRFNSESEDIRFRMSNENQAIFVSNAAKAVEGIQMGKATPEQWLKMIEKNGGLKAGEDKWMGLSDWLKASDKKTLTKDEVLAFVNENMIRIEEQHYSFLDPEEVEEAAMDNLIAKYGQDFVDRFFGPAFIYEEGFRGPYITINDPIEAKDLYYEETGNELRLTSDGELTYPDQDALIKWAETVVRDAEHIGDVRSTERRRRHYVTNGLDNYHEIALTVPNIDPWKTEDVTHFGDAGNGRAVVWTRFGEATLPNGEKVLVVDEVQSKRHDAGRKQGYADIRVQKSIDEAKKEWEQKEKELEEYKTSLDEKYSVPTTLKSPNATKEEIKQLKQLRAEAKAAREKWFDTRDQKGAYGIPDAPFEKNWLEVGMKRMLRYAAENGFDYVAWTNGEQQRERYSLAKLITSIGVNVPTMSTGRSVSLHYRGDEGPDFFFMEVDENGKIKNGQAKGRTLSEVVGKEVADQIMAVEDSATIESKDIRVGGEGLADLYDKMLPSFMNKYGKKWGVKVDILNLPNLENGLTMHSVPVTEEMKASVMEGQVMFRMRGENESAMEFTQSVVDEYKSQYNELGDLQVLPVNEETAERFGLTLEQLKKKDGHFDPETQIITIFANEGNVDSDEVENTIFHEDIHFIADFYPHMDKLGQWMWENASINKGFEKLKAAIESTADESWYHQEMLTNMVSVMLSMGATEEIEQLIPEDYRSIVKHIENEIGYDRQTEASRRKDRRNSINAKGAATPSVRNGKDSQTRGSESLTAEERRIINEYFPGAFPEVDQAADNVDENGVSFKVVTDQALLDQLDNEEYITLYRAMQIHDGGLYQPMAGKVAYKEGEEATWGDPTPQQVWLQSDETPWNAVHARYDKDTKNHKKGDLKYDKDGNPVWVFKLDKGNGKSLYANYNPYIHTSFSPLNDQFSEAQDRDNLVVVRVLVPKSELTSGYKAEKAHDAVGTMPWHSGPISGVLAQYEGKGRVVMLTRYAKIDGIVPWTEVADEAMKLFNGTELLNNPLPTNPFMPGLREELEKRGVQFVETTNKGEIKEGPNKGKTWASVYGKDGLGKKPKDSKVSFRFSPATDEIDLKAMRGISTLRAFNVGFKDMRKIFFDVAEETEKTIMQLKSKQNRTAYDEERLARAEKELKAAHRKIEWWESVNNLLVDTTPYEPDTKTADLDLEPRTPAEFIAQFLTMQVSRENKLSYDAKGNAVVKKVNKRAGVMLKQDNLRAELGWTPQDWNGFKYIISESEGKTLNEIAEMISEDTEAQTIFAGMDVMDIKNEIMNFLQSVSTYAEIRDYIKNERVKEAEEYADYVNGMIESTVDQIETSTGMTVDQYNDHLVREELKEIDKVLKEVETSNIYGKFETLNDADNEAYQRSLLERTERDIQESDEALPDFGDAAMDTEAPGNTESQGDSRGADTGNVGNRANKSGVPGAPAIGNKTKGLVQKPMELSSESATVDEVVNQGRQKAIDENLRAGEIYSEKIQKLNNSLAKLRSALAAQREYDVNTVKIITGLANELLQIGRLTDMSRGEIKRLLSVIKDATGKEDLSLAVERLMDIMIGNQLRSGKSKVDELMKVKASKVNASGVEVRGSLDVVGQQMMQSLKEGIAPTMTEEALAENIAIEENNLDSESAVIRKNAENRLAGYYLARQYREDILASEAEEKALRNEIQKAKEQYDAGQMDKTAYKEFVKSCYDAIRENRMQRVTAYEEYANKLAAKLAGSIINAKLLNEAEKARVEQIHHFANSDMQGMPSVQQGNVKSAFWNNSILRFLFKPLATFDQMLRSFAPKSRNGEGYLWNHFMGGWLKATENEYKGVQAAHDRLDEKVRSIFPEAKRWSDLFSIEKKMPKMQVKFWDGEKMADFELTQGNLLYIYMVNKMADGQMKLRKMGITDADVMSIARELDPRFLELADWIQNTFLPSLRDKYNAVHERLFGAPMAAIDNYFPIRVLANARTREVDVNIEETSAKASTVTGSIIKRTKNSLALDVLGSDAFDVVLEHIDQMEKWAAFAEFNKDLNTLLSYNKFRNRVQNMKGIYGAGITVWNNFRATAELAAGVYKPAVKSDSIDKMITNIAKGVTGAKISYRVYTALKQFLSAPAFVSDASLVELVKALSNPYKAWKWAVENLPLFEKRWKSRQAGDSRLMETDADWQVWKSKIVELAGRYGMTPNAFVDALTVSMGAKAIYETKRAEYLKMGYDQARAEEKAKRDATVLFNESQQSNEAAFLSTAQVDRTVASIVVSVFRNSSMGYQRMYVDGLRNIKHMLKKGYKEESLEFMTKQMIRDGLTEEQAARAAERIYNRSLAKNAVRVATFGFLVQFAWNLGPYMAYLLMGDDDEEKKDMLVDAAVRGFVGGPVEGLAAGQAISPILGDIVMGETVENPKLQLPAMSDVEQIFNLIGKDPVRAVNEIFNLVLQSGVGVNPQTISDAVVAIVDACNGDLETSKEVALAMMRILQTPQSQIERLYMENIDFTAEEALDMSIKEFAERYAKYKVMRSAPLTGWAYSDEREKELEDKYIKTFTKKAEELQRSLGTEEAKQFFEYYDNEYEETSETLSDLKKQIKSAAIEEDQKAENAANKQIDDFLESDEFKKYEQLLPHIKAYEAYKKALKTAKPEERDEFAKEMIKERNAAVELLKADSNK